MILNQKLYSVMFRRLDCLRRTQRFYSLKYVSNYVFDRESFARRHIGPNDVEQEQMLKELGYQVFTFFFKILLNHIDDVTKKLTILEVKLV